MISDGFPRDTKSLGTPKASSFSWGQAFLPHGTDIIIDIDIIIYIMDRHVTTKSKWIFWRRS